MSRDVPGDGLYLSGLGSFASRTCYANSSGDHLVRMKPSTEQDACCTASPGSCQVQHLDDATLDVFRMQFVVQQSLVCGRRKH